MARAALPRIAILGAGPIGIEAALVARQAKFPFTIYERGRVGEHLLRWGHVRLFSPFGMNATALGRSTILGARPAHVLPQDDAYITGREHVERYLAPIAETLKEQLRTETQVLRLGRRNCLKSDSPGDAARARHPFMLLLREKNQERMEEADVVLDCTGTYGQHRWLGDGGIPAIGEVQAEPQIGYALEDVLGTRRNDYAGKSILVVGGGYSAATTVCNLATLAEQDNTTWVTWLVRAACSQPLRRIPGDPLRERDRLAVRANNLATRGDGNVEFRAGTAVEAIEYHGQGKGFRVTMRAGGTRRTAEYDAIIANVGYTPDTNLYRELQVHECYATLGPSKLAAALAGQNTTDCLKITAPGAETLRNPEPNFYILGAKSYGRGPQFLLRSGFDQVRDVFELIRKDFRI
jgi:Pyridine nucleotide-disulphide oxidoreductase